MEYAFVNNIKTKSSPKALGICRRCNSPVRSYCGKFRIWHWKHFSGYKCDSWKENETLWHREWKHCFPESWQEHIIIKGNVKHEADVYNPRKDLVIEFQNSPIDIDTMRERESFYGKMLWVINVQAYKSNISLEKEISPITIQRVASKKMGKSLYMLGEDNNTIKSLLELLIKYIFKNAGRINCDKDLEDFFKKIPLEIRDEIKGRIIYIVDFYIKYIPGRKRRNTDSKSPFGILASSPYGYNEIKETINKMEISDTGRKIKSDKHKSLLNNYISKGELPEEIYLLFWKKQHIVWNYSGKFLFLDLGDDHIYLVKENLIEINGFLVKRFLKKEFIKHYSGIN